MSASSTSRLDRLLSRAAWLGGLLSVQLWAGAGAWAQSTDARPTRHALFVGIGQYSAPGVPALAGVVHDMASAAKIAAALAISPAQTTVLRDREATAERIRAEIARLAERVRPGDRVFFYYSGHGTRWQEVLGAPSCTEGLMATDGVVLTNSELGELLHPIARRADKMLVFYDACFSGGVADQRPFTTRILGSARITPKFTLAGAPAACSQASNYRTRSLSLVMRERGQAPENLVQIAAARPDEVSFDDSRSGGFGTVAWRDCLLGDARDLDGSGAISVGEVTACAQQKVSQALTGQADITGQHFVVGGNAAFVPAWIAAPLVAVSVAAPVEAVATPRPPAAAATPAQLLEQVHAQRDGQRRLGLQLDRTALRIGVDPLTMTITPDRDGYLYIALAGSDGQSLYLLYPNALDGAGGANAVRAGRPVTLPSTSWEIVANGPPGRDRLLVMVSDRTRELTLLRGRSAGPFVQTLLDGDGRSRLQWLLANGQDGSCAAGNACSDAFASALADVDEVP